MWFPVKIVKDQVSLTGKVNPSEIEEIIYASSLAGKAGLCNDNQLSYVAFCVRFTTHMINDTLSDIDFDPQVVPDNAAT